MSFPVLAPGFKPLVITIETNADTAGASGFWNGVYRGDMDAAHEDGGMTAGTAPVYTGSNTWSGTVTPSKDLLVIASGTPPYDIVWVQTNMANQTTSPTYDDIPGADADVSVTLDSGGTTLQPSFTWTTINTPNLPTTDIYDKIETYALYEVTITDAIGQQGVVENVRIGAAVA